jgi:eukaryotic-like serine/threonine-protein kinase
MPALTISSVDGLGKGKWLVLIAIVFLLSPACTALASASESSDDWSMFRHDSAQTGFTNSSVPVSGPKAAWTTGEEPKADFMPSSPVIADGIVYVADYTLYAFNASTGKTIREYNEQGYNSPAIENGIVYTYKGAFNAVTGTELWRNKYSALYFATVSGDFYYTCIKESDSDGSHYSVVALNASTGTLIWKVAGYYLRHSPAVADGGIYFGGGTGLVALDAHTGNKLWECEISPGVDLSPASTDGYVYANALGGNLYCINALTGQKTWNCTIGEASSYSTPAVAYGYVYIGSAEGHIYAIAALNGSKIWSYEIPDGNYSVNSSPALADGVVCVAADDGNLYALNAYTGAKLWNYYVGEQPITGCSPAIANCRVYIGSKTTLLIALETSSMPILDIQGQNLWIILLIVGVIVVSAVAFVLKKRLKN